MPYTQNQKLKSFILLQFLIVHETQNLKTKNATYMKKNYDVVWEEREEMSLSRLQFCPTLETENLETSESFCLFKILSMQQCTSVSNFSLFGELQILGTNFPEKCK